MIDTITERARHNMIEQQIRPWNVIDDKVLEVMSEIPREKFVPEEYRSVAFADVEIPLPNGRKMASPKIEAHMLQALDIKPEDNILVIGTCTGYLTACLAKLGGKVVSVDSDAEALETVQERLDSLNIKNASVSAMDLVEEFPGGRFDAILLTSSLPEWDERLERLMSVGGRLFVIIGQPPAMEAGLVSRTGEHEWRYNSLFETELESLNQTPVPESFQF